MARSAGIALFMISCLTPQAFSFLLPASSLLSSKIALGSSTHRSTSSLHIPLRSTARSGFHQRTVCRFEPGPGNPHRFPAPGSDNTWTALPKVFVLLFNPRTENEGIYTLQITPKDGIMQNTVVLFEEEDDATRFAGLLEAQDFPMSHVEGVEPSEIEAFTQDAGYQTSFIPGGTLFLPPETNVRAEMRLPSMPWHMSLEEDWSDFEMEMEMEDLDFTDYDAVRSDLERLFEK